MSSPRKRNSADAVPVLDSAALTTLPGDLTATRGLPDSGEPAQAVAASGAGSAIPLAPGLEQATLTLRNLTILPQVEGAGPAIRLRPRAETRYQRLKHLGTGAMGEVNLARDNDIGRTVAVKQLVESPPDATGIARFIHEIRTVGQLEHPNIVPIHDVGVDTNGQLFFVMKYIDGETLESIIRKLQAGDPEYLERYTLDYRIEIFLGVLHALQYAHAKGVIHRDIKPANVMVGRFGEVILMDWGVAAGQPSLAPPTDGPSPPAASELVGSPAYMSPEQASGQLTTITARSDIYSAAVLFHELLSLRHYLASCENVQQLLIAIAWERFSFLRLGTLHHPKHPPAPAELRHFIARGLAKNPFERFQSVDDMIAELQAVRDGRCLVRCPATLARRMTNEVGRFIGRTQLASMLVFYAVLLLLLGCVGVTAHVVVAQLF